MTNHSLRFYDYHVWANKIIFNRLKELPYHLQTRNSKRVFFGVEGNGTYIQG